MPPTIKMAIIAHEIGHLKLGHADNMDVASKILSERVEYLFNKKLHPAELEADAYGASIVGPKAMADALEYALQFDFITDLDRWEVAERVKILKNM
jgi:hypothetical protein